MGKEWDGLGSTPQAAYRFHLEWTREAFRVLKPGGHLIAFGGSRTYHRLACAAEDVGFEIRDQLQWLYGSGFPKGGIVKGPDKGPVRAGWGKSLKPAHEPAVLARKPLTGTVAANVMEHGTGALNIDGCRVGSGATIRKNTAEMGYHGGNTAAEYQTGSETGRWPANTILSHHPECVHVGTKRGRGSHDTTGSWGKAGSDVVYGGGWQRDPKVRRASYTDVDGRETVEAWDCHPDCPVRMLDEQSGNTRSCASDRGERHGTIYGGGKGPSGPSGFRGHEDTGGASRFFYTAKASPKEREAGCEHLAALHDRMRGNHHPTVKPLALLRYLVRLVTPPGGYVLDPFMGSGSLPIAAYQEGFASYAMEREPEYMEIAEARIGAACVPAVETTKA